MYKQTHRNKHKHIFEACVLFSAFSLVSSLVVSPSLRKGLWLWEGQGVSTGKVTHLSSLFCLFHHSILLQSLSEWDWQTQVSHIPDSQSHRTPKISVPSNKLTRLTLPPPSEQNSRHSEWWHVTSLESCSQNNQGLSQCVSATIAESVQPIRAQHSLLSEVFCYGSLITDGSVIAVVIIKDRERSMSCTFWSVALTLAYR